MIPLPPAPPGAFCAPLPPTPCKPPAEARRGASGAPAPAPPGRPCGPSPCTIPFLTPPQKILRRIATIRRRNYFLFGYGIPAKILSNGP